MNPLKLLQIKNAWDTFQANHPKFPMFVNALATEGLSENAVIDITITTPEGKQFQSNIKLTASDMELMRSLKDLSQQKK
ncbi:MAG TPA: hypothetical protein VJY54_02070 [Lachnospiraceae bacterium]|nr:hypothetical protein [Lachnospiraceae bacterium]